MKLREGLDRVVTEFEKGFSRRLATLILGTAQKYTPVDTGHMRNTTRIGESGGGVYLETATGYAGRQYSTILNHLIEGGAYRSISRASVGFSALERKYLKSLSGGEKFKEAYWTKYRKLKEAGRLTPERAEWFHRASRETHNPQVLAARQEFLNAARKAARTGEYYEF